MKEFPTLAAYQQRQAEIKGLNAILLVRHPDLYPDLSAGDMAREAAHFAVCAGCESCVQKWERYEAEGAAIRSVQEEVA